LFYVSIFIVIIIIAAASAATWVFFSFFFFVVVSAAVAHFTQTHKNENDNQMPNMAVGQSAVDAERESRYSTKKNDFEKKKKKI
jgi:1,4-dihydroxy-2-naphthoate octaprenyltransferase